MQYIFPFFGTNVAHVKGKVIYYLVNYLVLVTPILNLVCRVRFPPQYLLSYSHHCNVDSLNYFEESFSLLDFKIKLFLMGIRIDRRLTEMGPL